MDDDGADEVGADTFGFDGREGLDKVVHVKDACVVEPTFRREVRRRRFRYHGLFCVVMRWWVVCFSEHCGDMFGPLVWLCYYIVVLVLVCVVYHGYMMF